jgi:hypothetical protein
VSNQIIQGLTAHLLPITRHDRRIVGALSCVPAIIPTLPGQSSPKERVYKGGRAHGNTIGLTTSHRRDKPGEEKGAASVHWELRCMIYPKRTRYVPIRCVPLIDACQSQIMCDSQTHHSKEFSQPYIVLEKWTASRLSFLPPISAHPTYLPRMFRPLRAQL